MNNELLNRNSQHMKKTFILPVVAAALIGVTVIGVNQVSAQDNSQDRTTLVEQISSAFGLNQEEVQTIVDQHRQERRAHMQEQFQQQLEQKVQDGTISQEQQQLILQKHEEMKTKMEQIRNMDPEQRHQAMQEHHQEMVQWAQDNGIGLGEIIGAGRGMRKGFKAGYHMGMGQNQ